MAPVLTTRARAKVNLTLAIRGRRADGYHELESLVAFAAAGDTLTLEPADALALSLSGPQAAGLEIDDGNLVLRAARHLADEIGPLRWGRFHLVKRLPVASGIGGGSADAAAALRLLARLNGIALSDPRVIAAAQRTGADVPVCLKSRARIMAGIGERLGPPLPLPGLFAILVNPGVAVSTAATFAALGLAPGAASEFGSEMRAEWPRGSFARLVDALGRAGNDLQPPACRVAPVIAEVLAALEGLPGCRLARMSGSGATCFALFDDRHSSAAAARAMASARPGWWIRPTLLR